MIPARPCFASSAACALAGLLLVSAAVRADVTLLRDVRRETTTFTDRTMRTRGEERIRIGGDAVRIDDLMMGQSVLVRLDRKAVIHLNALRKTASTLSFDALAARRAAVLGGVSEARERASGTSDAARLDAVLRGFGLFPAAPRVERRADGERATIAAREATRVRFDVDGEPCLDLWLDAGGAEAKAYVEALAALQAIPPGVVGALRQAPGLPLREESRYAWFLDRVRVQAETASIDASGIPAGEFEAPAGYAVAPFALLPDDAPPERPAPPPAGR